MDEMSKITDNANVYCEEDELKNKHRSAKEKAIARVRFIPTFQC